MSEPKRLHPAALILLIVQSIKSSIVLIIPLFIGKNTLFRWIIGAIILLSIAHSILNYWFTKYLVSDDHIQLFEGIFFKKVKTVPYERIQTIHQNQWFFFQPFHLVELKIDTATNEGSDAEIHLLSVPETVLESIEANRHPTQTKEKTTADAVISPNSDSRASYEVQMRDIFLYGVTDLKIIATFSALVALINNFLPKSIMNYLEHEGEKIWRAGIIIFLFALILLILFLILSSVFHHFIKYYRFKIQRTTDHLRIESGLFKREIKVLPIAKIQAVTLKQQPLRRLLKLTTVQLLVLGDQKEDKEDISGKVVFIPIISATTVYDKLAEFLPEFALNEPTLRTVTKNSLRTIWYFIRWPLILIPLLMIGGYFHLWLGIALTLLFLYCILIGLYKRHLQGYELSDTKFTIQTSHGFTKALTIVERKKIQSLSVDTSKWLYPKHRGHVNLFIKTGSSPHSLDLRYMDLAHCYKLRNEYRKS